MADGGGSDVFLSGGFSSFFSRMRSFYFYYNPITIVGFVIYFVFMYVNALVVFNLIFCLFLFIQFIFYFIKKISIYLVHL